MIPAEGSGGGPFPRAPRRRWAFRRGAVLAWIVLPVVLAGPAPGPPGGPEGGGRLRVVDAAGEPVPGAVLECPDGQGNLTVVAVAGTDGRMAWARLPAPRCRVRADGFTSRPFPGKPSGTDEITLLRAAAVGGRLLDPGGDPAAGVQVETPGCAGELRVAVTDERGRFRLAGLDPGNTVLRVSGPGLLPETVDVATWPGITSRVVAHTCRAARLEFVSGEGRAARLRRARIREEDRGRVVCRGSDDRPLLPRNLEAVPAGTVPGDLPAGVPLVALLVPARGAPLAIRLRLRPGPNRVPLALHAGATLEGRLVDAAGTGLPGTRLELSSSDPLLDELLDLARLRRTTCGEGGVFAFRGLPAGVYLLRARGPAVRLPGMTVVVAEGERRRLGDVVARPGGSLRVRVVDRAGKPVPGARVRACPRAGGGCPWRTRARTGRDGRALLAGLRPGTWRVEAAAPGFLPADRDGLHPGRGTPVEIVLSRGGGIAGTIVDAGGRPVGAARLALRIPGSVAAPAAETTVHPDAEDGSFRWQGVPAGTWNLSVRAPGRGSATVTHLEVEEGEEVDAGEIVVEPGLVLRGRVTAADGSPVSGAEVVALGEEEPPAEGPATWTGSDGTFELGGLPREGAVLARAPGFAPGKSRFRVIPGEGLPWMEIVLDEGGSIEGRVTGPSGEPLAGATVEIRELPGSRAHTGADGSYVLEPVPRGRWWLTLVADPARPELLAERREVVLRSVGERLHVDFDLGSVLSGRVLRGDEGVPWARVTAVAAGIDPVVRTAEADAQGNYRLAGVSPGDWTLLVDLPTGCRWREPFSWETGGEGDRGRHDIRVPEGELPGLVLDDEDGKPLGGVEVAWAAPRRPGQVTYTWPLPASGGGAAVVQSDPRPGAAAVSGPDGSFRLCVPPGGTVRLQAEAPGPYEKVEQEVELPLERPPLVLRLPRRARRLRIEVPAAAGRASCKLVVERRGNYRVLPLGPEGEASLELPPGPFRAWAGCAGALLGRTGWTSPEDAGEAIRVDLEPVFPVRLTGFDALEEAVGEQPEGLSFEVLDEAGEDLFRMGMATGAIRLLPGAVPGEAVLEGLPAGRVRVRILLGGRVLVDGEVAVGAGSPVLDVTPSGP